MEKNDFENFDFQKIPNLKVNQPKHRQNLLDPGAQNQGGVRDVTQCRLGPFHRNAIRIRTSEVLI